MGTALAVGLFSIATLGCAQAPKKLPDLPLTMDNMANFTDKQDWQALKALRGPDEDNEQFLMHQTFLIKPETISKNRKFTTEKFLGGTTYVDSFGEFQINNWAIYRNFYLWNTKGELLSLDVPELKQNQLPKLSNFHNLKSLKLNLRNSDIKQLNIDEVSSFTNLDTLFINNAKLQNAAHICQFKNLTHFSGTGSYPVGQFDLSNCKAPLRHIWLGIARLDDFKLKSLPYLTHLYLGESTIHKLAIDGDTLPTLVDLDLYNTDLPTDLSQVTLPKGLVQLNLQGMRDNDISQLVLPENLRYINLKEAKLDDYSFITTAKNLESLKLNSSNFDQWTLLKKLPKLKHLSLNRTSITTDTLKYITQLEHLEYLDLSGTQVTSVKTLATLPKLKMLFLFNAAITDYAEIPYFENLIAFGIPNQSQLTERPDTLPEHILKMVEASQTERDVSGLSEEFIKQNPKIKFTRNSGQSCSGHPDCTLAPWYLDDLVIKNNQPYLPK